MNFNDQYPSMEEIQKEHQEKLSRENNKLLKEQNDLLRELLGKSEECKGDDSHFQTTEGDLGLWDYMREVKGFSTNKNKESK